MTKYRYFDELYRDAINTVLSYGKEQFNERTRTKITAFHGMSFKWDMNYYPLLQIRKMYPKTGAAEVAWMLSGETSTEFLSKYTSIWKQFEDTDNPGNICTAYGFRWKHAFGIDQIENIVQKLRKDPSSRQQVLMSWDAVVDNVRQNKNVPCPYTAVINIIDGKLNILLTLRSNDIVVGLPYDFLMYTLLGNLLANSLNVEVGELAYSIAHAHVYHVHLDIYKEMIPMTYKEDRVPVRLTDTINSCRDNPELFVDNVASDTLAYKPNDWAPRPKVVL